MPEKVILANRLVKIRKEMRQNQTDFAWAIGISVEALSLIERQKYNPSLETLQKIAAYTGLTVSELLQID